MGCGASRTWENVEAAADLDHSPTIWAGNIPSGFGHINSLIPQKREWRSFIINADPPAGHTLFTSLFQSYGTHTHTLP